MEPIQAQRFESVDEAMEHGPGGYWLREDGLEMKIVVPDPKGTPLLAALSFDASDHSTPTWNFDPVSVTVTPSIRLRTIPTEKGRPVKFKFHGWLRDGKLVKA